METNAQRIRRILRSLDNDDVELVETYVDAGGWLVLVFKDWARKDEQRIDVTIRIPLDGATITEG